MARRLQRANHSASSPGAFIFFDTETLPEPNYTHEGAELHKLRLGVAHYVRLEKGVESREQTLRFTKSSQFWGWVFDRLHPRIPTWLWAHNLPFDLTVVEFWKVLESGLFTLTDPEQEQGGNQSEGKGAKWGRGFMLLDDPPTVISGKAAGGGRLILCDSLNHFLTSLAKMGEAVGHPKLKMPAWKAPNHVWFDYCENDVVVLRKCILGLVRWVKENDLGRFRYTRAAQAMSAYRHRFRQKPIEYHDEPDVRALERSCYFGGRLECYYIGRVRPVRESPRRRHPKVSVRADVPLVGPIYELDVCSLYPHVMRSECFPSQLVDSSFERGQVGDWKRELGGDCVAVVQLDTADSFPCREKALGTYYPVGRYWTSLCGPELDRALTTGAVVDCAAWSRYHLAPLFETFVDYFWSKRFEYEAAGQELYAELCKYLMNSLYGKFGQLSSEWEDRPGIEPPTNWGPWVVTNTVDGKETEYRVVAGNVQERMPRGELFNTSPAIAAWVTAFGRELIRRVREEAGRENCLYLVTDAVYVTQDGYDRLQRAGWIGKRELGKLSVKHVADTCEIRGLHQITLGEHVKHGSIKPTAKRISESKFREIRFQHLASIIQGRVAQADLRTPPQMEADFEIPRHGPLPGVIVYPVEKTLSLVYRRGTRRPDGWIDPLILDDRRTPREALEKLCGRIAFSGYGHESCPAC